MSPELQSKIAHWRVKAVNGTLTADEMREAITALRQDRVGAAVASATIRHGNIDIRVTISIGVSALDGSETLEALTERADPEVASSLDGNGHVQFARFQQFLHPRGRHNLGQQSDLDTALGFLRFGLVLGGSGNQQGEKKCGNQMDLHAVMGSGGARSGSDFGGAEPAE